MRITVVELPTINRISFEGNRRVDDEALEQQANYVRILHEDGTMAVYAHLQPNSLRVKGGAQIRLCPAASMGEIVLLVVVLVVLVVLSLAMYLPDRLLPTAAALLPAIEWLDLI